MTASATSQQSRPKTTSSKLHRKLVAFSILAITYLAATLSSFRDLPKLDAPTRSSNGTSSANSPESSGAGGTSRFAYAFLVAGCDPAHSGAYRGYLYNVLAAKHILDASGSAADVVCMVRMAAGTNDTALPQNEEGWLRRSGVRVRYLAKADGERSDSFYTAMFDKFRLLELVEYERVMFLDSDAIPVCNMDYVFDLLTAPRPDAWNASSADAARRNLIIAYNGCPAQGGFFVLTPGAGEFDELNAIVRRQQESNYSRSHWPPFDPVMGWGSQMTSPWIDNKGKNSTRWDFYGGFADQGLLYHWTKYVKRDVSIVHDGRVQHWHANDGEGEARLVGQSLTSDLVDARSCSDGDRYHTGFQHAPYRDFHHFTGQGKPWLVEMHRNAFRTSTMENATLEDALSPLELWHVALRRQVERLGLAGEIDTDNLTAGLTKPPLGFFPTHGQAREHKVSQGHYSEGESLAVMHGIDWHS